MEDNQAQAAAAKHPLSWIPEFFTLTRSRVRSQARLLGAAVLVGVVAGVGAVVFQFACQIAVYFALNVGVGYFPLEPSGEHAPAWIVHPPAWMPQPRADFTPWLLLLIPTVGGILSGVLVQPAPEAEGHGTDAVIAAYHDRKGRIRYRGPIVKTVASAITIGTGGSGGREGPIAQIGAGFGFFLANVLKFKASDRRILMAAGMGAGVAAIFRPVGRRPVRRRGDPIGRRSSSRKPSCRPAPASVVSHCTFGLFFRGRLASSIRHPNLTFDNPWQLGPYLLLAVCMIVLVMIYTAPLRSHQSLSPFADDPPPQAGHRRFLDRTSDRLCPFLRLPQPIRPRLSVRLWSLANGYDRFGAAFLAGCADGEYLSALLAAISLGKILTTGLTIGSGGSGGVFGPSMVIELRLSLGLVLKVSADHGGQRGCTSPPHGVRHCRYGRFLRGRRQDALLHNGHGRRDDRQLQPYSCRPFSSVRWRFLFSGSAIAL